jgi:hypothetical protein
MYTLHYVILGGPKSRPIREPQHDSHTLCLQEWRAGFQMFFAPQKHNSKLIQTADTVAKQFVKLI